jgi:hypothetical protein
MPGQPWVKPGRDEPKHRSLIRMLCFSLPTSTNPAAEIVLILRRRICAVSKDERCSLWFETREQRAPHHEGV